MAIANAVKQLSSKQALAFCIWCAYRLVRKYERYLRQQQVDVRLLQGIIDTVAHSVCNDSLLCAAHLNRVEGALLACARSEATSSGEYAPLVAEIIARIGSLVDCARSGASDSAIAAGMRVINVLDYELSMSGDSSQVSTMFSIPVLQVERDRQLTMIAHLQAADLSTEFWQGLRTDLWT
jgi:hypothetical protein